MKKISKHLLAEISLEISPLTENDEGQLRGGFAGLGVDDGIMALQNTYSNCKCNNDGCENNACANYICNNSECTNKNCTFVTTTTTTTTTTKILTLGGNIGLLI